MIADVIRVSMPLVQLVTIAAVAFALGIAVGVWLRSR